MSSHDLACAPAWKRHCQAIFTQQQATQCDNGTLKTAYNLQVIAHRRRRHNYPTTTACNFKTVQYWLETYYATFTSSLILHSAFVAARTRNRKHCSLIMPRQMKTRSYIKPQISKRRIRASVLSSCTYERYDVSRFSSM